MAINEIYLKDLKVDNYKSLKDSTIELQMGLNIIIGKNGSGKSNLLEFINRYAGRGIINSSLRNINTNFSMSIEYNSDEIKNKLSYEIKKARKDDTQKDHDSPYTYELILRKEENNQIAFTDEKIELTNNRRLRQPEDKIIARELDVLGRLRRNYITFELPENASWLSKPNRLKLDQSAIFEDQFSGFSFFSSLEFGMELGIDSEEGLIEELKKDTLALKEYLITHLASYLESTSINIILNNYTPINEIRFNPNLNIYSNEETTIVENLSIDFLIDGDWMPWSYLSDGTKRLFYLITECLSLRQGIILVEEPELGIHPHQLLKILDFLKEQSRTKQVIISTHSPLSLDILQENELDRIIVAKYDKGSRFNRLTDKEINKAKKYINEVGELSYYWLHSDLEK